MKNTLALLVIAITLSVAPLQAQQKQIGSLSMGGIPHPATAALALFDSLDLSESQIAKLRRISEELEAAMFAMLMPVAPDTSELWLVWRSDPIDSAKVARSAHSRLNAEVAVTLRLLRARDEAFAILTADQRRRLERIVRNSMQGTKTSKLPVRECRSGGVGGGLELSDTAKLVYSLDFVGDSARINAIFVARADEKLYNTGRKPNEKPNAASPFVSGGSAGRWQLLFDKELDVAWVDSQRVALGDNNVVLVQGVDRLTRLPTVAGLMRVKPTFFTGGCRTRDSSEWLRDYVLSHPPIREFLAGKR